MQKLLPVAAFFLAFQWVFVSIAACQEYQGTTSRHARKKSVHGIPVDKIDPNLRREITDIIQNPAVYRQLPIKSIDVDPDLYLFLVRYPEVMVDTWRLMGVSQMSIQRTAPFDLKADDGAGTTSNVKLVYGTPTLNIYYGTGVYEGSRLLRKLSGRCVIVLRTEYLIGENGHPKATSQLDVFLKIDNAAAGFIAKTVHPLFGSTADHNFLETLKFVEKLSATSEKNGPGVQGMSQRLTGVRPEVRQRFSDIAGSVADRMRGFDQGYSRNLTQGNPVYGKQVYSNQMYDNRIPGADQRRMKPTIQQSSYRPNR